MLCFNLVNKKTVLCETNWLAAYPEMNLVGLGFRFKNDGALTIFWRLLWEVPSVNFNSEFWFSLDLIWGVSVWRVHVLLVSWVFSKKRKGYLSSLDDQTYATKLQVQMEGCKNYSRCHTVDQHDWYVLLTVGGNWGESIQAWKRHTERPRARMEPFAVRRQ